MKVPFYGHVKQYHSVKAEIDARMAEVLESGQYVMGPMLKRFEQELAAYHGMKYAVGVGNGTDALWLTFLALGIGPGDECITTTNTFFATA
jgi:dTDP-4-amino-4,6-dideoxygalactose transaminase